MIEGIVFEIQRFCSEDGPGIRSTVFLKGCPLRCIWCHNAEGLNKNIQLYYNSDFCIGCKRCAKVCPVNAHSFLNGKHQLDFSVCTACGACAKVCPDTALSMAGKKMTSDEVICELLKDKNFYDTSGGGITVSGGEPLFQSEFAVDIAKKAKENNLHVCIETSGYSNENTLRKICKYTDLILFDFKHYSSSEHKRYTGVGNEIIQKNLSLLEKLEMPVILRCPIVPGCNDSAEHYAAIGNLAESKKNIIQIHIEPYHPLGINKYASLGMPLLYGNREPMDNASIEKAHFQISKKTKKPILIQ